MKWLQLCIDTAREGLDPLEAMLAALGIDGIEIEDEEDFKQFLEHNEKYWDYVDEDLMRRKGGQVPHQVLSGATMRRAWPRWPMCAWRWNRSRQTIRTAIWAP